jgi:hypothetical protein
MSELVQQVFGGVFCVMTCMGFIMAIVFGSWLVYVSNHYHF